MNFKLLFLVSVFALLQSSFCLAEKNSNLFQLHRFYSNDPYQNQRSGSGVGKFTAIIISIVAGVLCFLGIMYYFKWRREGTVNIPFLSNRNNAQQPMNPPYNAPNTYPQQQPAYGGNPYGSPDRNQPGYNPNYPNYPVL